MRALGGGHCEPLLGMLTRAHIVEEILDDAFAMQFCRSFFKKMGYGGIQFCRVDGLEQIVQRAQPQFERRLESPHCTRSARVCRNPRFYLA